MVDFSTTYSNLKPSTGWVTALITGFLSLPYPYDLMLWNHPTPYGSNPPEILQGRRCTHPALRRRDEVHENATEPQPAVAKGCKGWSCGAAQWSGWGEVKGKKFAHFLRSFKQWKLGVARCHWDVWCNIGSSNLISLYHNIKMAKMTFWVIPKTPGQKVKRLSFWDPTGPSIPNTKYCTVTGSL